MSPVLPAVLLFVACAASVRAAAPGPTNAELREQVRQIESAFAKTMADRDHAAFVSFLAEETIFFGPASVLRGRQQVAEGWKRYFTGEKAPFSWAPESVEVVDSGTLAMSSGPVRDPDGKRVGTFNSVWRRETDGRWKIVLDNGCPPCDCAPRTPSATGLATEPDGWPQWGGPSRDFKARTNGLAHSWPAGGPPRRIWSRALGEGYSAIVADGRALYTMYRKGGQEIVVALDARSGETLWEFAYEAPFRKDVNLDNGPGPHATPLIAGPYLYTAGATSRLHCLEKRTGKVVWSHDLWGELGGTFIDTGYSSSPIAYKNTIIMTLGGPGKALVAFDQKDGHVVWKRQDFENTPSSPILIDVDGQEQLVAFMASGPVGVEPNTGELLWSHPHTTQWDLNISTPVWGEGNLLFCSSAYGTGSRMLRLTRTGGATTVEEVWASARVRAHKDNAMRVGDHIYLSSGDFGPAFFTAVEAKTGKVVWQDRSFAKASFLLADGRLIVLDEDGTLALATASPRGLEVHAKAQVLTSVAWTVPTLVGTHLYVRDRKTIMAFDLGDGTSAVRDSSASSTRR